MYNVTFGLAAIRYKKETIARGFKVAATLKYCLNQLKHCNKMTIMTEMLFTFKWLNTSSTCDSVLIFLVFGSYELVH